MFSYQTLIDIPAPVDRTSGSVSAVRAGMAAAAIYLLSGRYLSVSRGFQRRQRHQRFDVHSRRNLVMDNAPVFRSYEPVGRFPIFGYPKLGARYGAGFTTDTLPDAKGFFSR